MNDDHRTLDPDDWNAFRARAHRMLDAAIDKMETARDGRVWTPPSEDVLDRFRAALHEGADAAGVDSALASILPYGVGNTHPRFFGWVHGSGTPSNILADMVASALNANCGGRNHAAIEIERQVIDWARGMIGMPLHTTGLIVSGTSMATIIAMKAARDKALRFRSRTDGVGDAKLVGYTSAEAHACVARAFDMIGLGSGALRKIPVNDDFTMDTDALVDAIATDRLDGRQPFCIVGTAGSVNTGAIDDVQSLAAIAHVEKLWLHIDGAFGACGMLSERLAPHLKSLRQARSLAFDFHKWMHVNYDAGCVLINDQDTDTQRRTFSDRPDYLVGASEGLAANNPWPVEFGPELSRGFRALKVWAQIAEHGSALGALIDQNCDLAQYLAQRVDSTPGLERLAPVPMQIVCFRAAPGGLPGTALDTLNEQIVVRLQMEGLAAPSTTRIHDRLAIRVNITNHRTRREDIDLLVDAVLRLSKELAA